MNYSVIFEMLYSERSSVIFWYEVPHRFVFPGHFFLFKEKMARDLEQGALLRKF